MCKRGVSIQDLICLDLKNPDLNKEIEFAKYTASEKAKGERTYDRFKKRYSLEKFMNLFPGDLAKNLFRMSVKNNFGIELLDYDRIRKDNFENNDLFDLKYKTKNCEIEIEVKSSIEKYSRGKEILINNRRIIIFNKRGIKDVIAQVLFIPKNEECLDFANNYGRINSGKEPINLKEFKKLHAINDETDFISKFINCMEACIMGFTIKEQIKEVKETMEFQPQGETKREYLNIYIKDSFPIKYLPKQIKTICKK